MATTILHSANRGVRIGFDHPFCVIGERINPTGRKLLAAEMAAGDFGRLEEEVRAPVAAGAHMLDVNAGIPLTDEAALLAQCVVWVQAVTDVPLAIDNSVVSALAAGVRGLSGQSPGQLGDRRGGTPGHDLAAGQKTGRSGGRH